MASGGSYEMEEETDVSSSPPTSPNSPPAPVQDVAREIIESQPPQISEFQSEDHYNLYKKKHRNSLQVAHGLLDEVQQHSVTKNRLKQSIRTIRTLNQKNKKLEEIISKIENEVETVSERNKEKLEELSNDLTCLRNIVTYGSRSEAVSKCVVCDQTTTLIRSHPFSSCVLTAALGANYIGIFDLLRGKPVQPSQCKYLNLCQPCDSATNTVEANFKEKLESALECFSDFRYYQDESLCKATWILLDHADLFHIFTFRALWCNVDVLHYYNSTYQPQLECSCSTLFYPLHDFLMRARHLSQQHIWKERVEKYISPDKAGILFHIDECKDHFIEFPIICKVKMESLSREFIIIFAQIPPFYWAFPLPLTSHSQHYFPEEMRNSEMLVCEYFPSVQHEAKELAVYFPAIIENVNKKLKQIREEIKPQLQGWYTSLQTSKEAIAKESKVMEEQENNLQKEKKEVSGKLSSVKEKYDALSAEEKEAEEKVDSLYAKKINQTRPKDKQKTDSEIKDLNNQISKLQNKKRELNEKRSKLLHDTKEVSEKICKTDEEKKKAISKGLYADFSPKLVFGYFVTDKRPPCCLQIMV